MVGNTRGIGTSNVDGASKPSSSASKRTRRNTTMMTMTSWLSASVFWKIVTILLTVIVFIQIRNGHEAIYEYSSTTSSSSTLSSQLSDAPVLGKRRIVPTASSSSAATTKKEPSENVTLVVSEEDWSYLNRPLKVPKSLPMKDREEDLLFVHIGKTGGSSIRQLLSSAIRTCANSKYSSNINRTKHLCSLARATTKQLLKESHRMDIIRISSICG